jgi:hypothetical protein
MHICEAYASVCVLIIISNSPFCRKCCTLDNSSLLYTEIKLLVKNVVKNRVWYISNFNLLKLQVIK